MGCLFVCVSNRGYEPWFVLVSGEQVGSDLLRIACFGLLVPYALLLLLMQLDNWNAELDWQYHQSTLAIVLSLQYTVWVMTFCTWWCCSSIASTSVATETGWHCILFFLPFEASHIVLTTYYLCIDILHVLYVGHAAHLSIASVIGSCSGAGILSYFSSIWCESFYFSPPPD